MEDDLGSGGVGAVICDCGDPVAIMLGDVADDDSRGSPEVYHSVSTINAAEILDELLADISVSEHEHDGDGAKYPPFYGGR